VPGPLPTFTSGDSVRKALSPQFLNALIEQVRQTQNNQTTPPGTRAGYPQSMAFTIRNQTGGDLPYGSIVKLGSPATPFVTEPNRLGFQNSPVFDGETPDDPANAIAILKGPIIEDQLGPGIVHGLAVTRIDVSDAGHEFAQPIDTVTTHLESSTSGPARILHKATPDDGDIGWAVVMLQGGSSGGVPGMVWCRRFAGYPWGGASGEFPTSLVNELESPYEKALFLYSATVTCMPNEPGTFNTYDVFGVRATYYQDYPNLSTAYPTRQETQWVKKVTVPKPTGQVGDQVLYFGPRGDNYGVSIHDPRQSTYLPSFLFNFNWFIHNLGAGAYTRPAIKIEIFADTLFEYRIDATVSAIELSSVIQTCIVSGSPEPSPPSGDPDPIDTEPETAPEEPVGPPEVEDPAEPEPPVYQPPEHVPGVR
jgi:hypothetical protein